MALAVDEALATEDVGAGERSLTAAQPGADVPAEAQAGEDLPTDLQAGGGLPVGTAAGATPAEAQAGGRAGGGAGRRGLAGRRPVRGRRAAPPPAGEADAGTKAEEPLPGRDAPQRGRALRQAPFGSGHGGVESKAVDPPPAADQPSPNEGDLGAAAGHAETVREVALGGLAPEAHEQSSELGAGVAPGDPAEGVGVLGSSSSHAAALEEPDEDPLGAEGSASSDAGREEPPGDEAVAAAALSRRTELLAPVMTRLSRALKRALQDDQNELLDSIRHAPPQAVLDSLLPTGAHRLRYEQAASLALSDAWTVGRLFVTAGDDDRQSDSSEKLALAAEEAGREVGAQLALELTGLLRRRLAESFATAGGLGGAAHDITGAAYREWKGPRIEAVAGDFPIAAFSKGEVTAGEGTLIRWLVDDDGQPCPDCDDNSLAGPQPAGEPFPTGQPHPPVHAGCRCLLVPVFSLRDRLMRVPSDAASPAPTPPRAALPGLDPRPHHRRHIRPDTHPRAS